MRISTQNIACSQRQTSLLYIMSIQPVNKAAEHLINSTPVLEKEKKGKKKKNERERERERGGRGKGQGRRDVVCE